MRPCLPLLLGRVIVVFLDPVVPSVAVAFVVVPEVVVVLVVLVVVAVVLDDAWSCSLGCS